MSTYPEFVVVHHSGTELFIPLLEYPNILLAMQNKTTHSCATLANEPVALNGENISVAFISTVDSRFQVKDQRKMLDAEISP